MAKHLTSLKRTRDSDEVVGPLQGKDFFPHTLFMDQEDIKKLGIGNLDLGDERVMQIVVRVTGKSENVNEGEDDRRDMTLTILEGDVFNRSRAERLFGDDDGKQD